MRVWDLNPLTQCSYNTETMKKKKKQTKKNNKHQLLIRMLINTNAILNLILVLKYMYIHINFGEEGMNPKEIQNYARTILLTF